MRRARTITFGTAMLAVMSAAGCGQGSTATSPQGSATGNAQQPSQTEPGDAASSAAPTSPDENSSSASVKQVADGASEGSDETVTTQVLDWEGIQKLVDKQKGKVVVVDVWSTWCQPCVREFPNLVKLHNKYPEQVACISVNTNYDGIDPEPTEELRQEVLKFLKEQGAAFTNVICSVPDLELYEKLEVGGPPVVYVYDQNGKLQQQFDNEDPDAEEFTYQKDVIPLVEKLLADGS